MSTKLLATAALAVVSSVAFAAAPSKTPRVTAPVAKTGITACYAYDPTSGIWSLAQACTGIVGQDGSLQAGVAAPTPRFILGVNRSNDTGIGDGLARNGICDGTEACNGTVADRLTGLVWLREAYCQDFTNPSDWPGALASINNLASGICGLTDGSVAGNWRLPNLRELQSLIDYSQTAPALPVGHPFLNIPTISHPNSLDAYWSSTTAAFQSIQGYGYQYALSLDLAVGLGKTGIKTDNYPMRVWAVKGP